MKTLKGKNVFSAAEIDELERLIKLRIKTPSTQQKAIRDKMRKIGFYGRDDWGIVDLQLSDLKRLISAGLIKVIGKESVKKKAPIDEIKKLNSKKSTSTVIKVEDITNFNFFLEKFKSNCYNPLTDSDSKVDDYPGNYIICLKKKSQLPHSKIKPVMKIFEGYEVLYTGIAGGSLRKRDLRQHFRGNAGGSTLRKSLGVLFGYKLIPRDKDVNNGKTKFSTIDENKLSDWMRQNLLMYFYSNNNHDSIELELINHFNPPLNLKSNGSSVNAEFRTYLSSLRLKK